MWSDPDTQLAKDFRCQLGFENYTSEQKATTMLIKGPVPTKKRNSISLITQPVAHMEGPGCRTDGQNAATRSSAQPPSWAPDGRMPADGVSNQI